MTEGNEIEERELGDDEIADVEVFTGVRARSIRFGVVPEVKVMFEGEPGERSSYKTERENLPEEVEPGTTYREVGVRWQARSRIDHPTDPDHAGAQPADGESSD
jgi:hypothetical protein